MVYDPTKKRTPLKLVVPEKTGRAIYKHMYDRKEWFRLRAKRLRAEPFCRFCREHKKLVEAKVVDHIKPHKGDWELFIDYDNTQSLCKSCHDSTKQRLEKSGEFGCDVNGIVPGWKK